MIRISTNLCHYQSKDGEVLFKAQIGVVDNLSERRAAIVSKYISFFCLLGLRHGIPKVLAQPLTFIYALS